MIFEIILSIIGVTILLLFWFAATSPLKTWLILNADWYKPGDIVRFEIAPQERIKILSESWDYYGTGGFAYDVVRIPKWKFRKLAELWADFVVYVQKTQR